MVNTMLRIPQSRIAWIDYAKSMGIIGVMLCHSSSKVFQSVVFVDEIIKLFFYRCFLFVLDM